MRNFILTTLLSSLCVCGMAQNVPVPKPAVSNGCSGPSCQHSGPSHGCSSHSGVNINDYAPKTQWQPSFYHYNPVPRNDYWHVKPSFNHSKVENYATYLNKAESLLAKSDTVEAVRCFVKAYNLVNSNDYSYTQNINEYIANCLLDLPAVNICKESQLEILETNIVSNYIHYEKTITEANKNIHKAEVYLESDNEKRAKKEFAAASSQIDEAILFNNRILASCYHIQSLHIQKDLQSFVQNCMENLDMLISMKSDLDGRLAAISSANSKS